MTIDFNTLNYPVTARYFVEGYGDYTCRLDGYRDNDVYGEILSMGETARDYYSVGHKFGRWGGRPSNWTLIEETKPEPKDIFDGLTLPAVVTLTTEYGRDLVLVESVTDSFANVRPIWSTYQKTRLGELVPFLRGHGYEPFDPATFFEKEVVEALGEEFNEGDYDIELVEEEELARPWVVVTYDHADNMLYIDGSTGVDVSYEDING